MPDTDINDVWKIIFNLFKSKFDDLNRISSRSDDIGHDNE